MMTVDQMIEVLTAYKAGKKIQFYHVCGWVDCNNPAFDFISTKYRVKPEPRVIWVNEYADGSGSGYTSEADAKAFLGNHHKRVAVRYVESPEE